MSIKFADTMDADVQDRVCSILASFGLMVDSRKRMGNFNGNMRWLYWHEMEHQLNQAVFNTLRLLQILVHKEVATDANVERICEKGHRGFEDIIFEIAESFDTETE